MVTRVDTFSFEISVPDGSSARAMTTSSSGCRRMVSSASCSIASPSVVVARHECAALADEEVEVGTLVRLQDVVMVKAPVAALERGLGCLPPGAPLLQLTLADEQLQAALGDVELDLVAVLDQRERAACGRLGRHVQHHRAVGRAAHPGIGDPNH